MYLCMYGRDISTNGIDLYNVYQDNIIDSISIVGEGTAICLGLLFKWKTKDKESQNAKEIPPFWIICFQ